MHFLLGNMVYRANPHALHYNGAPAIKVQRRAIQKLHVVRKAIILLVSKQLKNMINIELRLKSAVGASEAVATCLAFTREGVIGWHPQAV